MQTPTDAPHDDFAMLGDRRNGVDRLTLIGTLDRSTLPLLEHEVSGLSHAGGALVVDLHNLAAVEMDAVRALQAMEQRAYDDGWWLFIVHSRESVRRAFEDVGATDLLSADVSTVLAAGAGDWAPISLRRPSPAHRVDVRRLGIVEKQP